MVSRVLVPIDGSEMSEHALEYALEVHPDADITVLHVVGEPSGMWGKATALALSNDIEEEAEKQATKVFESAREVAADHDIDIETEVALGHPAKAILNRSDAYDAIVLGSHGGTLADRLVVGNVAEKVFRQSPTPVTVVK